MARESRAEAYDRYARVLAAQVEMLQAPDPDLDRFNELTEERARIAREIDAAAEESAAPSPDLDGMLSECRTLDRAVIDRLLDLRARTVRALRSMDDRAQDRLSYLATARAHVESAHFDVTF